MRQTTSRVTLIVTLCVMAFAVTAAAQTAQFAMPAVLTSVGQSTDFAQLNVLFIRAQLDIPVKEKLLADELGNERTLFIVAGASSKGLGVAGVGVNDELARAERLISVAKERGMSIVVLHVGGEPRRGALSDQFIEATVPNADYVVVVSSGNKDEYFNTLAGANGPTVVEVDRITGVGDVIQTILGVK